MGQGMNALAVMSEGLQEGALYLVSAPLAVAALVATCLLLGTPGRSLRASTLLLVVAAATLTRWFPVLDDAVVVPSLLVVLGLALALNWQARGAAAPLSAVTGGSAIGLGGGMQVASWPEVAGGDAVLLALLLCASLLLAKAPRMDRFAKGAVVGRRMVGAWIAAIGVLMLALWWHSRTTG